MPTATLKPFKSSQMLYPHPSLPANTTIKFHDRSGEQSITVPSSAFLAGGDRAQILTNSYFSLAGVPTPVVSTIAPNYRTAVLGYSPKWYWRLGAVGSDESGNGISANNVGGALALTTGLLVGDADFAVNWPTPGVTDAFWNGSAAGVNAVQTTCVWANHRSVPAQGFPMFFMDGAFAHYRASLITASATQVGLVVADASGATVVDYINTTPLGLHFWVITQNLATGEVILYKDAVEIARVSQYTPYGGFTTGLMNFGMGGLGGYMNAVQDEYAGFTSILSADDITHLYQVGTGTQ